MSKYNYRVTLDGLHNLSSEHETMIAHSSVCGCFYCCKMFSPTEITEWIDGGHTAMCPRCGIDAVLPDAGARLSQEMLENMHERWF